jgi:hypothetical protein
LANNVYTSTKYCPIFVHLHPLHPLDSVKLTLTVSSNLILQAYVHQVVRHYLPPLSPRKEDKQSHPRRHSHHDSFDGAHVGIFSARVGIYRSDFPGTVIITRCDEVATWSEEALIFFFLSFLRSLFEFCSFSFSSLHGRFANVGQSSFNITELRLK